MILSTLGAHLLSAVLVEKRLAVPSRRLVVSGDREATSDLAQNLMEAPHCVHDSTAGVP